MTPALFLELLLGGLVLGGLYALMAFAFSLTLATTHVLNVAHGGFMVLGAAAGTWLVRDAGVGLLPALGLVAAGFWLIGALFQVGLVRPIAGRPAGEILVGSILITFGLALAIEALLGFYWARHVNPQPIFALTLRVPPIAVGGVVVSGPRAAALLFAGLTVGLFHLFLTRTRLGREARAVAQNRTGALVVGVDPQRVSLWIVSIGVMAAAVAGAFFVMAIPLHPYEGLRLTLVAFAVTAVGGVGNLPGALAAGVGLATVEVFTGFAAGSVWSPVVSLLVLFGVLIVRPRGLTGGGSA